MRPLAILACALLAGCISLPGSTSPTPVPAPASEAKPSACVTYTPQQESALAIALSNLEPDNVIIGAMIDYHNERIADGCVSK